MQVASSGVAKYYQIWGGIAEKAIFFSKRKVSSDTDAGRNLATVAKYSIARAFSRTDADALKGSKTQPFAAQELNHLYI